MLLPLRLDAAGAVDAAAAAAADVAPAAGAAATAAATAAAARIALELRWRQIGHVYGYVCKYESL